MSNNYIKETRNMSKGAKEASGSDDSHQQTTQNNSIGLTVNISGMSNSSQTRNPQKVIATQLTRTLGELYNI